MHKLLLHQWKEAQRSSFWQKSIAINILLGLLGVYLLFNFLLLSYFADEILLKVYPKSDVIDSFNRILLYYFSIDLFIRFLFQKLPILSIQSYLSLPIKKSHLLHFPLIKSIFSFNNFMGILLIIPFYVKVISTTQSLQYSILWLPSVVALIVTINYFNFFLKKYFAKNPIPVFLLYAIIGVLLYCDSTELIFISNSFANLFEILGSQPTLLIIPILLVSLSYFFCYSLLKSNSYIEDKSSQKTRNSGSFSFLNRFGEVGDLIGIELKMSLRNKRPRSLLQIGTIFLLYGFIFYKPDVIDDHYFLIIAGILLTSAAAINYSQLMFPWDSSYFDVFLANKISMINYIKAKYWFFAIICISCYLITLPYAFISFKIALINTAILLYNIGISFFIMAYSSVFSTTRVDLGKSAFMNYEGMGVAQFVLVIPLFGLPLLFQTLLASIGYPQYGPYLLGLIGLIAIACQKFLIQIIYNQLTKRKYKTALGFRQK